jgi:predicted O-linked N-acetylglucosamine transferase (SPINDLY family)
MYRQVLSQDPANSDSLHLLGLIAYQTQCCDAAVDYIRRAIRVNNRVPMYHHNLGLALQGCNKQEEAITCFRRALVLDPRFTEAEVILGKMLHARKEISEAEDHYRRALTLDPKCPEAHDNLGRLLSERGQLEQAQACHNHALALRPDFAEAHGNLGNVLQKQGKLVEALACYQRALAINPSLPELHINLGNLLVLQGRPSEAIEHYRHALKLWPDSAPTHNGLGTALHDLGRDMEAITHFQRALMLDPQFIDAYCNLGDVMQEQGRIDEAASYYRQALEIEPADGLRFKLATLLPVIPDSVEEILDRRHAFEHAIAVLARDGVRLSDPVKEVGRPNFYLTYHGLNNCNLLVQIARLYETACPTLLWEAPHCRIHTRRPGPVRVGFISKYLHRHSIGKTTRGLVKHLSRDSFRVYALCVPPARDDDIASFIRSHTDEYIELPATLEAARQRIAELELDVLFYQDIGMEPFTYFLAFARLAPVQCVSFGHPDTTGIRNIDYFISNDLFEIEDAQGHYSEKLVLLHDLGTLAYYYWPHIPEPLKDREAFGLPAEAHLYICPQTLFKFHPDFDSTLGDILRADPNGVLILIEGKFRHWSELLRQRFARTLPDVLNRILWLPSLKGDDFINLIAICDVMLDTPHFNGMNSSLEAFAVGTPVVTQPMALQRSRHTFGMYKKMDIHDCVAGSLEEYVKIAVQIGTDPRYRQSLRERIRAANAVLYEDSWVVQEFERFFTEAVARVSG